MHCIECIHDPWCILFLAEGCRSWKIYARAASATQNFNPGSIQDLLASEPEPSQLGPRGCVPPPPNHSRGRGCRRARPRPAKRRRARNTVVCAVPAAARGDKMGSGKSAKVSGRAGAPSWAGLGVRTLGVAVCGSLSCRLTKNASPRCSSNPGARKWPAFACRNHGALKVLLKSQGE